MINRITKLFLSIVLLTLLISCQFSDDTISDTKDNELRNEVTKSSSALYLSFTVTHAVEGSESTFESDIYYYGLKEKQVKKVATIPYTSAYPIGVYDANDKMIYYSASATSTPGQRDELYQYNVETGEITRLTSSLHCINYIIPTEDMIILGAISKGKDKTLGPKIYDKKTGEIKEIPWNDDDFINQMTYNPLTKTTVFSSNSIKEEYSVLDIANNAGVNPEGIRNKIYTMQGMECKLEFEVEKGYIHNIVANKKGIYYQQDTSILRSSGPLSKYQYNDKTITKITHSKIIGQTIYISEDEKEIYFVNGVELVMQNLETNNIEVIFKADQSKEAINNAHILEKR